MTRNPVVFIHGYSDNSEAFKEWEKILEEHGYNVTTIHTASYKSLTNEVKIKDIAEAFDRALRIRADLNAQQEFDAIVHSTGMLVIRAWLTTYAERRDRLKRLIGLAPATFGSPLAHKGRSWLGALFKGNRNGGSDFLEAGDLILDSLELGSSYTWDLAHLDLIGSTKDKPDNKPYYGKDSTTPYVFIFCGNKGYEGLSKLANTPGSDGTVRWAGCALNTRKIIVDLKQEPARRARDNKERAKPEPHPDEQINIPIVLVKGKDHGTIMSEPDSFLIDMVFKALKVSTEKEFNEWNDAAKQYMETLRHELEARGEWQEWQQFVFRAVDERNDPITDYNIQFFTKGDDGSEQELHDDFDMHVHAYSRDKSLRCFHVNLTELNRKHLPNLWMRLIASSGSQIVGYYGYGSENISEDGTPILEGGIWDAQLDLSHLLNKDEKVKFFCPFTTTLVEFQLNREPLPLGNVANEILKFIDRKL